jgi:hypothetical protein
MKWLMNKLAPGAIVTVVVLVFAGVFSHAADSKSTAVVQPAPAAYQENAGYLREDPRRAPIAEQRYDRDYCDRCGAPVDGRGRAIEFRDHDRREIRGNAPQVVYVVHVNANGLQDLRDWPQSIYPLSTRWAMPIRKANCSSW